MIEDDILYLRDVRARILDEMFGIDGVVNALLVALICRRHVLLEGNPGLGKTALIRALGASLDFGGPAMGNRGQHAVGRIQFTPDLMPSDITGTRLPDGSGTLAFKEGPIFCNLLLADEINRATPKTQAAMLEAMAETQVTVLGETHRLTKRIPVRLAPSRPGGASVEMEVEPPFLVLATQNPVEQEGTYPLPEAQLDRFLFKVRMPFPKRENLAQIVNKVVSGTGGEPRESGAFDRDSSLARLQRLHSGLSRLRPSEPVQQHILNLVLASNGQFDELEGLSRQDIDALRTQVTEDLTLPLGPRAAIALTEAALGWALVNIVDPSEPDQAPALSILGLAQVMAATLRHRVQFESVLGGVMASAGGAVAMAERQDAAIHALALSCAPQTQGYRARYQSAAQAALESRLL